jgi:hypothetical protein
MIVDVSLCGSPDKRRRTRSGEGAPVEIVAESENENAEH